MSENNKPAVPSGESEEYKSKVLKDAFGKMRMGKKQIFTPEQALIRKAEEMTVAIREHMKPILAAGGWKDKGALRATFTTLYLQAFNSWSKDELINLSALLHMEIAMQRIEADPYASGVSDLLSGE